MRCRQNLVLGSGHRFFSMILILTLAFLFPLHLYKVPEAQSKTNETAMIPANFTELAQDVSPAVVNIRTVKTIKGGGPVFRHFQRGPWGEDDPFRDFFERFFGEENQRQFKERSLGSGFIIDQEGYIVTNNHVIEDADEIMVKLNSGDEFEAEIQGRDPNTDLALLKIESPPGLPTLKMGNSEQLKVGQWVVAIGSPFGLEHTVTAGIVSAKGRVIGSGPYDDFIQTDASINPGNSGGPLLNLKGEVVGINTAIIASGQGIGFAIPINMAQGIIEELKKTGEVTRGWLGVAIQDLSRDLAEYYGIEGDQGVLIARVFPGDPADQAGIKEKDIILSVNGEKIESSRDLTSKIADLDVGRQAEIKVLRGGKKKTFTVTISKRDEEKLVSEKPWQKDKEEAGELGIQVSNINPEMAQRFNLSESDGVVVSNVKSGSKADEAGFQTGDIIREINHKSISSVDDFRNRINEIDSGEDINFFIQRINAGFLVIRMTK